MRSVGPGERNNIDWCLSLTQGKERNAFNPASGMYRTGEKVDRGLGSLVGREKWKTGLIGIGRGVRGMLSRGWSH